MTVEKGTTLEQFWQKLGPQVKEAVQNLSPQKAPYVAQVPGVGRVEVWLDECSEGRDRGGFVPWYKLLDVLCDGKPVVLESETDGSELMFADRSTVLF